jgi:type III secretory pathway component EscU
VFNLHVEVERALRTVSLIASEVRTLMSFLNFIIAPAEMSLSATRVYLILAVSGLISDLTLVELCRHWWKRWILSLALLMVICYCIR